MILIMNDWQLICLDLYNEAILISTILFILQSNTHYTVSGSCKNAASYKYRNGNKVSKDSMHSAT